ncbi:MAG: hypothetical protein ACAH80_17470 [Alphaproteobacteria bacterium]
MADDISKPTEADAYQRFPDAETPQGACAGVKLVDGAKAEWEKRLDTFNDQAGKDRVKVEVAAAALANLTEEERRFLPNSAKVYLASRVPNTPEGYEAQAKVLSASSYGSMGFTSWEEEGQAKFYRALAADPFISEAQQRWNDASFGDEDRLEAARRIHQLQMDAFGGKQEPISLKDDLKSHGTHYGATQEIKLSRSPGMGIHQPVFAEFLDTISHETMHSIQQQIIERAALLKGIEASVLEDLNVKSVHELAGDGKGIFAAVRAQKIAEAFPGDPGSWNRELRDDGRLAGVVPMFRYQMEEGGYMPVSIAGEDNYIRNPIEMQAFFFGSNTAKFIKANTEERSAILTTLDKNAEIDRSIHARRTQERETILTAPKPCQCT